MRIVGLEAGGPGEDAAQVSRTTRWRAAALAVRTVGLGPLQERRNAQVGGNVVAADVGSARRSRRSEYAEVVNVGARADRAITLRRLVYPLRLWWWRRPLRLRLLDLDVPARHCDVVLCAPRIEVG